MADTNDNGAGSDQNTQGDQGNDNAGSSSAGNDSSQGGNGQSNQSNARSAQNDSNGGDHRTRLSDEEQLAVLEGRAERLRTKLGKGKPAQADPANLDLSEKAFLRAAGITDDEEAQLARDTAKKWGMSVDKLVDDEDFKEKLDKLRTKKANAAASSGVNGSGGDAPAKSDDFFVARGTPPTPEEVPNRKDRARIVRLIHEKGKNTDRPYHNS